MHGLNLKGFKKVHEDDHHTTMQHPQGHQIKIAHKALSPKMRSDLGAIPLSATSKPEQAAGQTMTAQGAPMKTPVAQTPTDLMAKGGSVQDVDMDTREDAADIDYQKMPEHAQDANGVTDIDYRNLPQNAPKKMAGGGNVVLQQSKQNPPRQRLADGTQDVQPQAAPDEIPVNVNATQQAQVAPQQPTDNDINYAPLLKQEAAENAPYQMAPAQAPQVQPNGAGGLTQANNPYGTPDGTPTLKQSANADPWGTQAYEDIMKKADTSMRSGLTDEATQLGIEGQKQADAIQQNLQTQQQQQQTYQDSYSKLDQERQAFQQDLQNQHIDPQHYLNSMGTMGKISSAIGLILGGIGGGLTHQGNPALAFLQNQIDRDIEGQRLNMGKSESLLSANTRQFGNLRDATDMTRVMQMDIVGNMMKQAAAKAQGPIAQAKAQQALAEWGAKTAPIMSQIAMRRTLLGAGAAGQVAPEQLIRMMVPEGEKNETFKQLKEAQDTSTFRDNAMGAFDKLAQINTLGNRATSPLQSGRQAAAIMDPITAALSKGTAGRFTEADAHMLQTMWPAMGDSAQTIAQKRHQLQQMAEEKLHYPMLEQWGINARNFGRYQAGTGQKRIQMGAAVR